MKQILLSPAGGEGNNPPEPSQNPPQPAPTAPASPPPAGAAVVNGKTERELVLEREIETERAKTKERETQICELQDENFRLKAPPKAKASQEGERGWTMLDCD